MKYLTQYILLIALCLAAIACEEEKKYNQILAEEEETQVSARDSALIIDGYITDQMYNKAVVFRNAAHTNSNPLSVYVYQARSVAKYRDNPEKLAARLLILGFSDIYLSATNNMLNGLDTDFYEWTRRFNATIHTYGAKVHALRFSGTGLFVNPDKITEDAQSIHSFNNRVADKEQFDAATADLEPHMLSEGGPDTPKELEVFWDSTNGYGIGNSNDILLGKTLEILSLARQQLEDMPLSEAIGFFWQSRYNDGLLSQGSTKDFLESCNPLIVMSYHNTKEGIWNRSVPVLEDAKNEKESVFIGIKTSINTYGDNGDETTSLQPQGWAYLLESLEYLYKQSQSYPAYKGICIFEFEGLETMWEWTNDKE